MFEDEFGFSFCEPVATTWAPRGQTPVLKGVGKYRREVSTMAGVTLGLTKTNENLTRRK